MFTGKIVEEFKIDGDFIRIRYIKFEDFKDLQEHINYLVEEGAYIDRQKKVNKKEELEFVTDLLKKIENKESVALVAEINGKVMGLSKY